jgi:hypothetical protein
VLTDITRLDGVAVLEAQRIPTTWRGVPALGAEAGLDWLALPWLRVGLRGGPTWLLRTQDYALGATSVLALSRIAYEATLALGFGYHDP